MASCSDTPQKSTDFAEQWKIVSCVLASEEKLIDRSTESEIDTMSYFFANEGIGVVTLQWLHDMYITYAKKISEEDTALKCSEISLLWKERGNVKYHSQLFMESYECYNKSVLYAPKNEDIYAIALSNRSQSLTKLGRYQESLDDIMLALEYNYPNHLRHKALLRRCECHVALNQMKNAQIALAAAKEYVSNYAYDFSESDKKEFERQVTALTMGITELSINEPRRDAVFLPPCHFGENSEFKAASNSVELKYCPDTGRSVVTSEPLNRGDVLFSEEPYAWVTLPSEKPTCEMCCTPNINPVPCNQCSRSVYCSDKCRSLAAVSFHKWECLGAQCGIFSLIGVGHLALRVLLTSAERGFPDLPMPPNGSMTAADLFNGYQAFDKIKIYHKQIPDFYRMFNLMTNFNMVNSADYALLAVNSLMLTFYLESFTNFFGYLPTRIPYKLSESDMRVFVGAFILRCCGQLVCNGHSITTLISTVEQGSASGDPLYERTILREVHCATAIYPSAAMMNHSCDPNIITVFYKNHLLVKSSRELPLGAEILNCYGPNRARESTEKRRAQLKAQYMFTCSCASCCETDRRDFFSLFSAYACQSCKGPVLWNIGRFVCQHCNGEFNIEQGLEMLDIADELMDQAEQATNITQRLEKAQESFRLRQQVWHRNHMSLRAAADRLAMIYADMGDYVKSAELIKQNIQSHEYQYGSFSVQVALELKKLSCIMVERIRRSSPYPDFKDWCVEAYKVVRKAIQLMELNYGSWEPVVTKLQMQKDYLAKLLDDRLIEPSFSVYTNLHYNLKI